MVCKSQDPNVIVKNLKKNVAGSVKMSEIFEKAETLCLASNVIHDRINKSIKYSSNMKIIEMILSELYVSEPL